MAVISGVLVEMKLLAVIPAHNEERAIGRVVASIKDLGHDVLVIDDGSQDSTRILAGQAGAEVISTGQKSGKGTALRAGFDYALQKGYDAVITVDGDGQHDPDDIAPFITAYEQTQAGIINGNRMQNPTGMPLLRLATNGFMSLVISLLCRQKIPDTQCGFRLVTADVLKNITLQSSDFEIETEILVKASKKGFKIASVPVVTIYRDEKSKIKPLRDTGRFIRYLARELSSRNR
jgi:glycosyltransferase involved in cell wall biosynthesis